MKYAQEKKKTKSNQQRKLSHKLTREILLKRDKVMQTRKLENLQHTSFSFLAILTTKKA